MICNLPNGPCVALSLTITYQCYEIPFIRSFKKQNIKLYFDTITVCQVISEQNEITWVLPK